MERFGEQFVIQLSIHFVVNYYLPPADLRSHANVSKDGDYRVHVFSASENKHTLVGQQ